MAKLLDGTRVYGTLNVNTAVIVGSTNVVPYIENTIAGANSAVGGGANAFTRVTIAGANAAVGVGANSYANTIGTRSNSYASTVGTSANLYASSVGVAANDYASAVGVAANNFASATIAGANSAVGIGANNYSNATFLKLTFSEQTITGNLSITGRLSVSGNAFTIDTETLKVSDPLIYLAGNNYSSDIVDIGFVGNYVNSTGYNVHTGFFRDATNKQYYLFEGYDQEPIPNHIDTAANNFTIATLNSNLITNNLNLGGVNAITWIASAFDKANSANIVASGAFDKANAANVLAYDTGIGANNWANTKLANTSGISFDGYLSFPTGNVGVGVSNATSKVVVSENAATPQAPVSGTIMHVAGADSVSPRILFDSYGNTPVFSFRRAQGTAALPSAVTSDLNIVSITAFGYGSTGYSSATRATFNAFAQENWTDTAQGTGFRFLTTGVGTTTIAERMRITGNGLVGISTTTPSANLDVTGNVNVTSAATVAGMNVVPTVQAAFDKANTANLIPVGNTVSNAFTLQSTRNKLNFIAGSNITINVDDDAAGDRVNITITSTASGGLTTFRANVGNSSANTFNIAHSLNKSDVIVQVKDTANNYLVYPDVQFTTPNHIVIQFVSAPTTNLYNVLVAGV